jgi:hypothetical protein
MHAVLITFTSSADLAGLEEPFTEYAQALRTVPGLVSKTWIHDGPTLGGFHVFSTAADAERYLSSQMVADLTAIPAFSDFEIRHFEILDRLSEITGTKAVPLSV